jgi:hypothetical protein
MRRFLLVFVFVFCIIVPAFSQNRGNIRYISVLNTTLNDSPVFFAKEVVKLSLGNEVTLISVNGKWSQVRFGNLTGWIATTTLSLRKIVASGTTATATEISMAGKGFSPEMEMEYRKTGLDYSMVDYMEEITIPKEELLSFITQGSLARGER